MTRGNSTPKFGLGEGKKNDREKVFKLNDTQNVVLTISTSGGTRIEATGITMDHVIPVTNSSGAPIKNNNGYIMYKLKTTNPLLKDLVLVYECGWWMDWDESMEFANKALKSEDEWR